MVCDGSVCELERGTETEMQAWVCHKEGSAGVGTEIQLQNSADLDMDFEAFTELYANDVKNRLKEKHLADKGAYHSDEDSSVLW